VEAGDVKGGAVSAGDGERVGDAALDGLKDSYKEVLDATKHQDDKIGRIFTGVAFLTAAALALANLNSSSLLTRQYTDTQRVPLAVLSLGAYLILVIICVTLLISSLSTPLRLPGLKDTSAARRLRPKWIADVPASQIYFVQIARLPVEKWNRKWLAFDAKNAKIELAQSLVLETHNLAVRTQFKYNRTTEAVIIFKFALMFLSITAVLCIAASLTPEPSHLMKATKWAIGVVIASYLFFHFQEEIRYSRQTIDELKGWLNTKVALLSYGWALCVAVWAMLAAVGTFRTALLVVFVILGSILFFASTFLERKRNELRWPKKRLHWFIPVAAFVGGIVFSFLATCGTYYWALGSAIGGAAAITLFALCIPTLQTWLNAYEA
jgi:hypothetical protein